MTRPYALYQRIRYIIDVPLLFLAFIIIRHYLPEGLAVPGKTFIYLFLTFSVIAWYGAAQITGLYRDLRSNKFSEEIVYIFTTLILFGIFLTSLLFFLRWNAQISNVFVFFYFSILFFLVTFFKYLIRKFLHRIIYMRKLHENVLIVGSTPAAEDFYDTINKYYYYGYKCLGFLDDDKHQLNGCKYFGKTDQLSTVLETENVDEVIIALPNAKYRETQTAVETCDFHGKRVRIIPDFHTYASSNIQVNNIGLLPVINLRSLPQDRWGNRMLKRSFDLIFSLLFFFGVGVWLIPLIALIIKLNSKGPVFFKQERWGINNKKIVCYKFRSMYHGSIETASNGKYLQASKNDPRVTPVGRFLRKTNLDELPQFWNVLIGNMSVVGPRPHPTPLNIESIGTVDRYMLRHLVKPGITGWAQVNGYRGETPSPEHMQKRVNLDLYYIHRWTFWLDCQIILQTLINVFRGDQNAY